MPTSFGSYVTAQCGSANTGGNGQYGETKFCIVKPGNNRIMDISIGAGGSIDIYYLNPIQAQKEATQNQNAQQQNPQP